MDFMGYYQPGSLKAGNASVLTQAMQQCTSVFVLCGKKFPTCNHREGPTWYRKANLFLMDGNRFNISMGIMIWVLRRPNWMTLPFVNGWPAGSRNPNSALTFWDQRARNYQYILLASRLISPENVYCNDPLKNASPTKYTLSSWWVIAIEDVQVKLDLPQVV